MCLIAPPKAGGAISTRNFIPHRVHDAIGVFGAVSVATACVLPGTVAADVASVEAGAVRELEVEHPSGFFTVSIQCEQRDGQVVISRAALLRTARRLMRGDIYVPAAV
jgi:4-oxalomesaconate tautomerase